MHPLSVFCAYAAYWGETLCLICTIPTQAAPTQFLPSAFSYSCGRILPTYHQLIFLASASDSWMVPVTPGNISPRVQSTEAPAGSRHFPGLVQQSQKTSVPPSTADPLNKYYNLFIQVFEEKTQHTVSGIGVWECMWQLYQEYWEIPISLAVLSAAHKWLQKVFVSDSWLDKVDLWWADKCPNKVYSYRILFLSRNPLASLTAGTFSVKQSKQQSTTPLCLGPKSWCIWLEQAVWNRSRFWCTAWSYLLI